MKKLMIVPVIVSLMMLPGCWLCCRKKCEPTPVQVPCPAPEEKPVIIKKQKRISGPLSEKEVGWDNNDLK